MKDLSLLGLLCIISFGNSIVTEVDTEYGRIKGDYEPDYKLTGYYGIPFAAPPVDDLRFKPPFSPKPWSGTKDCQVDKFFHVCPQFHIAKKEYFGSEDCLYANIYVPEEAENETLPVMFWIYGGGFILGDEYDFGRYRGKKMAASQRVIVVEHNYRVGALGYLSHPLLKQESNTTGNYGAQDQVKALKFVSDNIDRFGGDPNNITIFGESAGSMSVCWHLANPSSRGLFSAAIMESGSCDAAEFFVSEPRANLFSRYQIEEVGCDPADTDDLLPCLRSKQAYDFFMNGGGWSTNSSLRPPLAPIMPWGPVIDKSPLALPDRPLSMIKRGDFAKVPLIIGTNKDEGTIFVYMLAAVTNNASFPIDEKDFGLIMQHFFNETTAKEVAEEYPLSDYKSQDDRAAHIARDFVFLCASRRVARELNYQQVPSYLYQFTMDMPNNAMWKAFGDYHSSEINYVFDNTDKFDKNETRLMTYFQSYWTSMAKAGHPNSQLLEGQPSWKSYDPATKQYLDLNIPTTVRSDLDDKHCDFWDKRYTKYYFD